MSFEYYYYVEVKVVLEYFYVRVKEFAKKEVKREIYFLFVKVENKDFNFCI